MLGQVPIKIYIDETGYNMLSRGPAGFTEEFQWGRGSTVPWGRGGNATVIAAIYICVVEVFYHELHFGPVNGEIFNHSMASLEAMVGDFTVAFIMENASIQNSMPETYPTLQFKYLPPYSPF